MLARVYFHDYMSSVRNLSDKSMNAYKQSLKTYLAFLKETKSLANYNVTFDSLMDENPHKLSTDSFSLVLKKEAADIARETCNDIPNNVHCHLMRKTKVMDL